MREKVSTIMGSFGRLSAGWFRRPVNIHAHKEPSVLFHLGGGDLRVTMDDRDLVLGPGVMLLFDSWTAHARRPAGRLPSRLMSLVVSPERLGPHGAEPAVGLFPEPLHAIDIDLWRRVNELASIMLDEPTAELDALQRRIDALIAALRARYVDFDPTRSGRNGVVDFRVRRAFDNLRRHAIDGVRIEALVAGSGMSRSHFFRQFKRTIGVSPQQVIDEERMSYALQALGEPNLMLSQLSRELGFSAPAHFTRFFIQHAGCTPSHFRRNLRLI